MSAGAVKNPLFIKAKNLEPERGGLFDPVLTGGNSGTKWSHIDLHEPTVNPVFERPVKALLGTTGSEFEKMLAEEGGSGIRKRLSQVDVDREIRGLRRKIPELTGANRDNAVKKLKYLMALKKAELKPQDAYVVSKVPVIPPVFRPIIPGNTGDLQVSDSNWLYRDTMLANDALKGGKNLPQNILGGARKELYHTMGALYGTKESDSPQLRSRKVKGFISRLSGTGVSPKRGFFQSKLVKRRVDLSGRGTIAPDPTLNVDEIGLPEDMAWSMYQPVLMKNMIHRGYAAMEAKEKIDERHPAAREELLAEIRRRPVLFNRAPSLDRYNVLAAYPKLVAGKTIRVHEMHAPLQSGDFDGDAIQIHVPVLPEAVEDAKKMLPSNMLLTDQQKFKLNRSAPMEEAVMGVYMATSAKPTGQLKRFKTKADAMAAYHRGEINLSTPVRVGR